MPWVGLKCVIVVLPDHTHLLFIGQFMRVWYLSHKRTSKDQKRLHIGAVSPEPLQIAVKRMLEMKAQAKFNWPVQESWVLVTYASSGESGETSHWRSIVRAIANRTKKM